MSKSDLNVNLKYIPGVLSPPPSYISKYNQSPSTTRPSSQLLQDKNGTRPPPPSSPPRDVAIPPPPNYPPPDYAPIPTQPINVSPYQQSPQQVLYPVYAQPYPQPQYVTIPGANQPIVTNPTILPNPMQSQSYVPVAPPVVHKKIVEYGILHQPAPQYIQNTPINNSYTHLSVVVDNTPNFYRPVLFHDSSAAKNVQRPIFFYDSNEKNVQKPVLFHESNAKANVQRPIIFFDSNDKIPDAAKIIGNEASKAFSGYSKFY
jgi:hypothetical protein